MPLFESSEATPYDKVNSFDNGIEERVYPVQNWSVTVKVSGKNTLDKCKDEMFQALEGYFSSKNYKVQKIPMTVPISTRIETLENSFEQYSMSFYIPKEFQDNPPKPTDPMVKIVKRNLHVYSITFGGFAKQTDFQQKYEELLDFLKTKNMIPGNQEPAHFFVAYDNSGFKLFNRRNEVWIQVG